MRFNSRTANRRNNHGIGLDITIAPLIDIVFLLLIFFMLITRFMNPVITVDIPQSDTSTALDKHGTVISLSERGDIYLNREMVNLEQLELSLATMKNNDGIELLRIRSDKSVEVQRVIEILDIARRLQIENVAIETRAVIEDD